MNSLTCANPECDDALHADSDHVRLEAETVLMQDANSTDEYYFHMECWFDVADDWESPA